MKHINTGLCYLYLEAYAEVIARKLYEHSIRGLNHTAILMSKEEAMGWDFYA